MRVSTSLTTTLALAAAAVALNVPMSGAAQAPTIELQPQHLDRGPDISVPHVEGDDFVDGDRRVDLPGARAVLLGASGKAWIVGTTNESGTRNRRIIRVRADGSLRTLLRGVSPWEVTLSEDGRRLAATLPHADRSVRIRVWSARTGARQHTRVFRGYPQVLTARGTRVLLSDWGRGVFWWNLDTGRTRRVIGQYGRIASIEHDLLATFTRDPYDDGCQVLRRLDRPGRIVWRSCRERVEGISPNGRRIATVDLLSDGIGPSRVFQRRLGGRLIARYDTSWFGRIGWEDPKTMLLEVNGDRRASTVRCVVVECENATDPVRVVQP